MNATHPLEAELDRVHEHLQQIAELPMPGDYLNPAPIAGPEPKPAPVADELCEECGAVLAGGLHFDDCTIGHGDQALPKGARR